MTIYDDFEDYVELARSLLGSYQSPSDLWEANDYVNAALSLRPADPGAWLLKSQILSSLEDESRGPRSLGDGGEA